MQPKRPRFNPLVLALALAAVLMIWSMLGTSTSSASSSMTYSTVVNYFEHLQVTEFTLDRNTGVIAMKIKEGDLPLPGETDQSTTESTGGLLSGMLAPSQTGDVVQEEEDGTVTVRYQLPYAAMFVENVTGYIEAYNEANPDAPMVYDYVALKETIPWMEILFYLAMLGCTGFILFSMLRGGAGGGNSGIANTASHTHTWKAHTAQKWVSNIVTVVDQPEKTEKYSIYKMYWYNTGKWEETRDPQRFNEWYKSKNGGLYTLYNPYAKPEDNPLFIGYDKNGNPQYTNDHTIIGPYYDVTPAVTHEEDHGHYETYVDYYYCDCGARK